MPGDFTRAADHAGPGRGRWVCWALAAVLLVWQCAACRAAPPGRASGGQNVSPPRPADAGPSDQPAPADYRSAHFILHTDLPSKEAHALLRRLETMLSLVAKYFGKPMPGMVECYVVRDLNVWPEGSLEAAGRAKIAQRSGITHIETLNRGAQVLDAKAVVYAIAERGTPQHESVHAYCGQTFGRTGPLWYSEGMAELGTYWQPGDASVQCPSYVIRHLRNSRVKSVREVVAEDGTARGAPARTGDSWRNYAWRWALCHLLVNNPNYSDRFRALGLGYLSGAPASFGGTFGAMLDEIDFEYRFFLDHVEQGFRVDLCSWDWKRRFRDPASGSIRSRIAANRGWQPAGILVRRGEQYTYETDGVWHVGDDKRDVSPDGLADGRGRLECVLFADYQLGEPFALSAGGTFTPAADGKLFLRCRDRWNELADNSGVVAVTIRKSAGTEPGPREAGEAETPAPAR